MPKKTSYRYRWSMRDAIIVVVALVVLSGVVIVVFDVDVGGTEWEPPTTSTRYVVTISSNATTLNFTDGVIGWWPLDLVQSPSATVEVKISVFVNMSEGAYFQLAEYYTESGEWVAGTMQEGTEEQSWLALVSIGEDELRQFAIWVIAPDGERRGTSARFYLQSIGGKIVVGPV